MLLAVDVGNTTVGIGFFREDGLWRKGFFPTVSGEKSGYYGDRISFIMEEARCSWDDLRGIVVGSVVPEVTPALLSLFKQKTLREPLLVNPKLMFPMRIDFDDPAEVGADRLANAAAVRCLYPEDTAVVVDFGTAVTFDVVDRERGYIGGVIFPGPHIMAKALTEETALLPAVEFKKPGSVIGRKTEDSMLAGIFFGSLGGVEHILRKVKEALGRENKVIFTGGGTGLFRKELSAMGIIADDLTLYGLRFIYRENNAGQ